jgi:aryl-alcohol dehydrogenase-like predicted oxidoreductase
MVIVSSSKFFQVSPAKIIPIGEQLIGNWFAKTGRRSEIFLATKFGSGAKTNNMPSYIRQQFKKSLTNLQTDYVDLYYVHLIDPKVPIEITLETLREFVDAGKIKWIGLSEASVDTLRRAKAVPGIGEKVVAAQMEYSIMEFNIVHSGFLNAARELGVSIVAYSPLCRGMLTGK